MYLQSKVTITSTSEVMTTAYKEVFSNNYSLKIGTIIEHGNSIYFLKKKM